MATGSFRISPDEATRAANTLTTEEEQIVADIRGSIQIAQNVAETFKGAAAASYQGVKSEWDAAILKMDAGMQKAITELNKVIQNYQTTDAELSAVFRR